MANRIVRSLLRSFQRPTQAGSRSLSRQTSHISRSAARSGVSRKPRHLPLGCSFKGVVLERFCLDRPDPYRRLWYKLGSTGLPWSAKRTPPPPSNLWAPVPGAAETPGDPQL